jgi:hypothetical protein
LVSGEERPLGEKGDFFENVITGSHLPSLLSAGDRSNALWGNEKRQKSRSRSGLVGGDPLCNRETPIGHFASSLRWKALARGEIRDWA